MASRKIPEINAGSMADIAFLLLVFFLVTTTIKTDAGLNVLLPPYEEVPQEKEFERRNVFSVQINASDGLLFRNKPGRMADLKDQIKEFIMNPNRQENFAESPQVAVVTLLNDNGTSYNTYITVYNEVKRAYSELWNEKAEKMFGRLYENLDKDNQKKVRDEIPLVISEAEPTDFQLPK